MNINREDFLKQLDKIFESQLKNILTDEEKANINLAKQLKENDVFIIEKTNININDSEFLTKINLKNKKKLQNAIDESGKAIIVVYNNRKTPILISGEWDNANNSFFRIGESNYIKVSKNNKHGLIDLDKNIIIKPIYEDIDSCLTCHNYLWVKTNDSDYSYGLIDMKENKKTPCNFFFSGKKILNFNDNILIFGKSIVGECVFNISKQSYMIKENLYEKISVNEENEAFIIRKNNKFGVIKNETRIIEPIYEHINIFNNIIQATVDKRIGLFDMSGKVIAPIIYERIIKIDKDYIVLSKNKIQETIQIRGK